MSVGRPPALTEPIPFFDLRPSHDGLKAHILAEIADVIDSGTFANGPQVAAFEHAFADFCGRPHCIGVSSGLDALRLALLAAGVESGDEVILPANTFAATIEAVLQAGAVPVLADASEADYNLDVTAAAAAVTSRTRFLLPVHLYGQLADMRSLARLAAVHRLRIVEDACQAHGAVRDGIGAATLGTAAAFSFYPAKNLGAMGDAGAVVAGDSRVAARVRVLREHGQRRKYQHILPGYTARLDTFQALVLLRKLPLLRGWNEERRMAARQYSEALEGIGDLRLPPVPPGSEPVWHLYVVRTSRRPALQRFLDARGIGTGRHYPQPLHLAPAYAGLGYRAGAFPVAEALARDALSLPMFPGITVSQIETVVAAVEAFFRG